MKTDGQLGKIFREAMIAWDAMKADGISFQERVKALALSLRPHWPFAEYMGYQEARCGSCDGTGLTMHTCPGDATCGPPPEGSTMKRRRIPHLPHDFGSPCWCALGARFRPRQRDDFEAAGKMPAKTFTRAGR